MSHDDVLFGYRLRLFTLAEEIGVRPACRAMGVHHSTYYRVKRRVDRWGLEALRIRERRRPRMPNEIGPHLEQRVIAFSLGHPGFGAQADLGRAGAGEVGRPAHLRARGLARAVPLWAEHPLKAPGADRKTPDPYERKPDRPPPERHIDASEPGEKVQLDCFYVGRLQGTKGCVWQYTAADVASGFAWAELHATPKNPRSRYTGELVHRVARELKAAGWRLQRSHHGQRL